MGMTTDELLALVLETLDDIKALDVRSVDVRGKSSITDIMVIASGTSDRHVKSIAERVALEAKNHGVPPIGMEGEQGADWVLVDLNDVVLHVMLPATRDFYNLEKLWEMDQAAGEG